MSPARRSGGPPKPLLTVGEAAILLGRSRTTLYRSIQRGEQLFPVVTFNGRLRIPLRSVERLIEGIEPPASAAAEPQDGRGETAVGHRLERLRGACPVCGSLPALGTPAPRRRPMCSAARRSSSAMPSV